MDEFMNVIEFLAVLVLALVITILLAFVIIHTWNFLMPGLFGVKQITFIPAFLLVTLFSSLYSLYRRSSKNE